MEAIINDTFLFTVYVKDNLSTYAGCLGRGEANWAGLSSWHKLMSSVKRTHRSWLSSSENTNGLQT